MSPAAFGIRGVGALVLAAFLTVLVGVCAGCGASALDRTTTTLGSFRAGQAGFVNVLERGLEADLEEHCDIEDEAARRECATARAEDWESMREAAEASGSTLDALAQGLLEWARAVRAREADEDRPPIAVCDALSRLTAAAAAWSQVGDVQLPVKPWRCS